MFFAVQCCGTRNKAYGNGVIDITYLGESTHQKFFPADGSMQNQVIFNGSYACISYEKHEISHGFAMWR